MAKAREVTVVLDWPITWEGKEIKELTFRRMKNSDLLAVEGEQNQMKQSWMLQSRLCGMPLEFIEEMDPDDREVVDDLMLDLMGKGAAAKARKALAAQDAMIERMLNPPALVPQQESPAGDTSPGETD